MNGIIVNNYASLPVTFKSGNGVILTDTAGKTYIDFVSGIGVNCLGHNHPLLVKALTEQIKHQIHISNYYNSDKGLEFAQKLTSATKMDGVFFANSGAEANEAAIKLARKYGSLSENPNRKTIITLKQSFHGRTLATLKATGQDKFHNNAFSPYPEGFSYISPNDFDSLESLFDNSVCALLIECIQGEGGVNLISKAWAQKAALCARKSGALVMVDEVQTGMGRTGTLLASEQLQIQPDIITLAKGIAAGIPMGACLFAGKARDIFCAGDHQSTFGGNPLACSAGLVVLEQLQHKDFLDHVKKMGELIIATILQWDLACISAVRGRGLMIGIDIALPIAEIQKTCLQNGLCVSTAGTKTIRFLPPLIISEKEIHDGLEIFLSVLKDATL